MRKLIPVFSAAVLLLCGATQSRADTCNGFTTNLVSNCGFESGSLSGWTGTATTAGPNYAGVDNGDPFTTAKTPYAGTYEAYLGEVGSTFALTQSLSTVAGTQYLIEFALLNDTTPSSPYSDSFSLLFGGTQLFSESAVPAGNYVLYSFVGSTTLSSTPISFVSRNDDGYFELDSVSVVANAAAATTPEPANWMLLGTGLSGIAGLMRKQRRAHSLGAHAR